MEHKKYVCEYYNDIIEIKNVLIKPLKTLTFGNVSLHYKLELR